MGKLKTKRRDAPKSLKRRYDSVTGRRLRRAALLFLATGFVISGSLIWHVATQNDSTNDWPMLAIFVSFLAVVAAALNMVRVFWLLWFYRCPQCRARLTRTPGEEGDPVRYTCAK